MCYPSTLSLPNLNTSAKEGKASILYPTPGSYKIQLLLLKSCSDYNTIPQQLDREKANDQELLKDFILVKNNTLVIY